MPQENRISFMLFSLGGLPERFTRSSPREGGLAVSGCLPRFPVPVGNGEDRARGCRPVLADWPMEALAERVLRLCAGIIC